MTEANKESQQKRENLDEGTIKPLERKVAERVGHSVHSLLLHAVGAAAILRDVIRLQPQLLSVGVEKDSGDVSWEPRFS